MKNEIEIKGFIDNNLVKQKEGYEKYSCVALTDADLDGEKTGIIITVSQIQRSSIIEQLE